MKVAIDPWYNEDTANMLKFKHCECGCKGRDASIGKILYLWYFHDVEKQEYRLHLGHAIDNGRLIQAFKTREELLDHATAMANRVLRSRSRFVDWFTKNRV